MYEFRMPSLGAAMDFGTVVEWRVEPGDTVERGDIVCEVETQKGNIDVEIWESGTVEEIAVPVGERVPVGQTLMRLATEGEAGEEEPAGAEDLTGAGEPVEPVVEEAPSAEEESADREPVVDEESGEEEPVAQQEEGLERQGGRGRGSPAARKRAAELGLNLEDIAGSGPDGAVLLEDVERADVDRGESVEEAPEMHPPKRRVSPVAQRMIARHGLEGAAIEGSGEHGAVRRADVEAFLDRREADEEQGDGEAKRAGLREAIGEAMARSKREIPHYYLEETIEMSRTLDWLGDYNEERSIAQRLLLVVPLLKAVAVAAGRFPEMNGFFRDGGFEPAEAVHVGVAVSMPGGGVVAPAIHAVDQKSCAEIMTELRDLVGRVRRGKLRSSEMTDPTITVTSLGDQGVEKVYGVIYPPQVALVGFGRVTERPWAQEGMVGVQPVVTATLAADHRVSDGIAGSRFLAEIRRILRETEEL